MIGVNPLDNICLLTDSYKYSHAPQYPPGTETIHSYLESRGGEYEWTQMFGPQYFLKRYLVGPRVLPHLIDHAERLIDLHLTNKSLFSRKRWDYIYEKHGGNLPLDIHCIPEGTRIPTGHVLMTVENTDRECWWLTNFVESLLVESWYPITVATLSQHFRDMLAGFIELTGSDPDHLQWMLHDFGFRGVSSPESAAIGGLAHLSTGFRGTDTVPALVFGDEYYGHPCAGKSIPAYEHSTVTSWGEDGEEACYANALDIFPTGPVAVVSDSWNIWNAIENIWGGTLRERVLNRDGRLIIRPDSFVDIPRDVRRALDLMGQRFPTTVNAKGYRVLDTHVRLIQGDGVNQETARQVLLAMIEDDPVHGKWAAENIVFGMGGALLQKVHRDTSKFAFKCSEATVNGKRRDVFKRPFGMPEKNSKRGRFKVVQEGDKFFTLPETAIGENLLQRVFLNGSLMLDQTFDSIRGRADKPIDTRRVRFTDVIPGYTVA